MDFDACFENICELVREKAKYMADLNSTVKPVPAREHVFVLTDANARTGKRGEGDGETDSKVLGAYGRDVLNENGNLLLGFAEDNKLAHLTPSLAPPNVAHPSRFKAPIAARAKHASTTS